MKPLDWGRKASDRKVVHLVTVPQSMLYLSGQIRFIKDHGFQMQAIASSGLSPGRFGRQEEIDTYSVELPRRISPLGDLVALVRLVRILGKIRPTIVHTETPKGGLLGMIAAFLVGVPVRIFSLFGLRLGTARGLKRVLLRWTERIGCLLASRILPVGASLRRIGTAEGLVSPTKTKVLSNGSVDGVDALGSFNPIPKAASMGFPLLAPRVAGCGEYRGLLDLQQGNSAPASRRHSRPSVLLRQRPIPLLIKRLMDIAVSLLALILVSPILAAAALLIRLRMGKPVFFHQPRPGQGGVPFTVLKLRTLLPGTLPDEQRMTTLGRLLRASSVDELPQLWNVLRGDMSLVGPRPLMMQYLDRYSPEQARRHDMKPGMTGWAQVHGRNSLSWEEKFRLDLWYVDHWSPALDLWTLVLTVGKVLSRRGIAGSGEKMVTEFMGSPKGVSSRSKALVEMGSRT